MIRVQTDVPLAPWSTLAVGGPARWFVEAASEGDVCAALEWAETRHVPVHILGGGSNVVIADAGFAGLVVRIAIAGIDSHAEGSSVVFRVGSGEPWDPFVAHAVEASCAGVECLSGVPGLVGGTPIQNVGAYGQDVSETIRGVRAIDRSAGRVLTLTAAECGFGYRTSRFKHTDAGRFVVTGVEFVLTRGGAPRIAYADVVQYFERESAGLPALPDVRRAILEIRRRKGMVIEEGNPANKSVGSFFVNPVVTSAHFARIQSTLPPDTPVPHYAAGDGHVKIPAAWLIEQAGFARGSVHGRVGMSPFQSQAIVNLGDASSAEIVTLAAAVKRAVWNMFRITLVPEPVFVGFGENRNVRWLLDPPASTTYP